MSRIVTLGDSLTAAPGSWAEILRGRGWDLANLAVPGDTTVHAISRFDEVLAAAPALALVLVGTNDARRHGRRARTMLVSDRETARNLRMLVRLLREDAGADVVLVTPPPVLEERIARAPELVRERVRWLEADVTRKAALVAAAHHRIIDSRAALTPPLAPLLGADGLHLSARGQRRLARWIARSIDGRSEDAGIHRSVDAGGPIDAAASP